MAQGESQEEQRKCFLTYLIFFRMMRGMRSRVGQFLQEKRRQAGLTAREVARALGLKRPSSVTNWELGRSPVPLKFYPALARLYGCAVEEVLEQVAQDDPEKARLSQEALFGVQRPRDQEEARWLEVLRRLEPRVRTRLLQWVERHASSEAVAHLSDPPLTAVEMSMIEALRTLPAYAQGPVAERLRKDAEHVSTAKKPLVFREHTHLFFPKPEELQTSPGTDTAVA